MIRTTRTTAVVIIPVPLAAFVILFGFPDRTPQLWAWTIRPDTTAVTIGSGYLGGAWFFFRVARNREPGRVVGGLAAASVYTTLPGLATLLHRDRFNHDHVDAASRPGWTVSRRTWAAAVERSPGRRATPGWPQAASPRQGAGPLPFLARERPSGLLHVPEDSIKRQHVFTIQCGYHHC